MNIYIHIYKWVISEKRERERERERGREGERQRGIEREGMNVRDPRRGKEAMVTAVDFFPPTDPNRHCDF